MYAEQILSSESDTVKSEEAVEASKVFVKQMAGLASERRVDNWTRSAILAPVHKIPVHIMYLFENVYKDAALFEKITNTPQLHWSNK